MTTSVRSATQLEAALYAASKFALITNDERDAIRSAFDKLSESEKEAFLDGHLEHPVASLPRDKRERFVTLMHSILSRLPGNVKAN